MPRANIRLAKRISIALILLTLALLCAGHLYIRYGVVDMPGDSHADIPETETDAIAELSLRLKEDVEHLANTIGGRSVFNVEKLDEARGWIIARFRELGFEPNIQAYEIDPADVTQAIERRNTMLTERGRPGLMPDYPYSTPQEVANVWVEIAGHDRPERLLVVGAHYDTVTLDCPGAEDNASGVAGLLEVARRLKANQPTISVCLVAFTCEEHPVGGTAKMGSAVFARNLLDRRESPPVGMISLEMLGYFSTAPGSQKYPPPFGIYFPDTANFIGFVGDASSRPFVRSAIMQFRALPTAVPSEGIAAPVWLVPDVLRSDHAAFILNGVPGLMVTDTSNFRYAHLHKPTDTSEKLDYIRMAYVVDGMAAVIQGFDMN